MSDDEDEIFNRKNMPDENEIVLDTYAEMVVRLYKAFKRRDLTVQEAASLAAAIVHHTMPTELEGPQDGS